MKKFLFLLGMAVALCACDGESHEPDSPGNEETPSSSISVSIDTFTVLAEGGTEQVTVTSSDEWALSGGTAWCTPSKTSGKNGDNITFTVSANESTDDRNAMFTLSCGTASAHVTITQKQKDALTVTTSKFEVSAEGGSIEIEIKANVDVTYTIDAESVGWISLVESRSLTISNYVFTIAPNTEMKEREGGIVFTNGVLSERITVRQEGSEIYFDISPTQCTVPSEGGEITIVIHSNIGYHITGMPEWIVEKSSSTDDTTTTYVFTVAPNENTEQRRDVISFCNDNDVCIPVIVTQEGAKDDAVIFEITPTSFNVDASGGDISVAVTTNIGYHFTGAPDWISEKSTMTEGMTTTHVFTVAPNKNTEQRKGVISFCNDNEVCIPVVVTQEAQEENGELDDSWKDKEFYHRSLAMRFTATWCGWCPRMAESIKLAQDKMPDKIETVALHGGGSNLEFNNNYILESQYLIDGFPTGIVDGRTLIANYDKSYTADLIVSALKETEANYPTVSGIAFTSSISGQELTVDLSLYLKKADSYKVTVIVTENGIVGYQSDYEQGEHPDYTHNYIARLALTDLAGDDFSITEDFTERFFQYKTKIPSDYKKENLRILVYVQRAFGSQKRLQSADYGNYYVDNCVSEKVGVQHNLETLGNISGGNENFRPGGDIIL